MQVARAAYKNMGTLRIDWIRESFLLLDYNNIGTAKHPEYQHKLSKSTRIRAYCHGTAHPPEPHALRN